MFAFDDLVFVFVVVPGIDVDVWGFLKTVFNDAVLSGIGAVVSIA